MASPDWHCWTLLTVVALHACDAGSREPPITFEADADDDGAIEADAGDIGRADTDVVVNDADRPSPPVADAEADDGATTSSDAGRDSAIADAARDSAAADAGLDSGSLGCGDCTTPPRSMSPAGSHTCAIRSGEVWCWGRNVGGELGDGTQIDRLAPARLAGISSAVQISGHCALMSGGSVACWGRNSRGQIGSGSSADPVLLPEWVTGLEDAIDIGTMGGAHSCAVRATGRVVCWGANEYGQLGTGDRDDRGAPAEVVGLDDAVEVETAGDNSCALRGSGAVVCWGRSVFGRAFGDGLSDREDRLAPGAPVTDVDSAIHLVSTDCVLNADGSATCWARTPESEPVEDLVGARALTASSATLCALMPDGGVLCRGSNVAGLLGNDDNDDRNTFEPVVGLSDVAEVVVGPGSTACALTTVGEMLCWGSNGSGQIGDGNIGNVILVPEPVRRLARPAVGVAAGERYSCALMEDGGVACWGDDRTLQVGHTTDRFLVSRYAFENPYLDDVLVMAPGQQHVCVIEGPDLVLCWGKRSADELGDGSPSDDPIAVPMTVSGPGASRFVGSGFSAGHTCAVSSRDGSLTCWGANDVGQLGNGSTSYSSPPVPVTGLTDVLTVSASNTRTCALTADGDIWCWGSNGNGALGDGTTTDSTTPVRVIAPERATQLAGGGTHSCAVGESGGVFCWGSNYHGELGGDTPSPRMPVEVAGLADIASLCVGRHFSCAVDVAGAVRCWGREADAHADGTRSDTDSPVTVPIDEVSQIACGADHVCAVRADGVVLCWGNNDAGAVGTGSLGADRWTPERVRGLP